MRKAGMLILALLILAPIVQAGTPIGFEVVVSDSSFMVDSLGLCGAFDTLWPDTTLLDSVLVYEMVNGLPVVLANYGSVPVNSVQQFLWVTPSKGSHLICVAGFWQGFKGCESCMTFKSFLKPPKARIKP